MSPIESLLSSILEALLFGSNSRTQCEEHFNHLNFTDFEQYSVQELKTCADQLNIAKPKFDELREALEEKKSLLDFAYERLSQLYFRIQELIDAYHNEATEKKKEIPKEKIVEEESNPSAEENRAPAVKYATTIPLNKGGRDYLFNPIQKNMEHPKFLLDTSKIWKIDCIVELYEKLTHCQTNPFDLLKAVINLDFEMYRKKFRSRNLFYVWLNLLSLSDLIVSKREWLKYILHSDRIKLCRDAFRKCRNKDVLKCSQDLKIALNLNQRMWSEKLGLLQ